MSTRSNLLDDIVTQYVVLVSKYKKIYKMQSFVELIKKQVYTPSGRQDMASRLVKIQAEATKADQRVISRLIDLLCFYELYVD